MNKEELLECLKSLSTTNNKRDGIDIKKEEAQLIIEIINNYKKILDKIKEYIKENTRYYDKKLGLVEIMGAGETRTPVIYLYGLLELLEEIE